MSSMGGAIVTSFAMPLWTIALAHSAQGNKFVKIVQPSKGIPIRAALKIAFRSACSYQ